MSFNPDHLPPPPNTVEDCHAEIFYLQKQLFVAREQVVKKIVQRELDFRALKGALKRAMEDNENLKKKLNKLNENKGLGDGNGT